MTLKRKKFAYFVYFDIHEGQNMFQDS